MERRTHRLLIFIAQASMVCGAGLAALWNLGYLFFDLSANPGWWGLLAPLPGLALWGFALVLPALLSVHLPAPTTVFRLVYAAPAGWNDAQARTALLNLPVRAGWLDISWVREMQGSACRLAVPAGYEEVLNRLVSAVFPGGQIEADDASPVGDGVTILRLKQGVSLPTPAELCLLEGIDGVYFRWQGEARSVFSLWGEKAPETAQRYAGKGDLLTGSGDELLRPRFSGGNPWPELPPFPVSGNNPGLSAVSGFERLAPSLRLSGPGLVVGRDAAGGRVGFPFPDLEGAKTVRTLGQGAARVTADLVTQALRARRPVCLLDGDGGVTALLNRMAMRELAREEALLCDLDRPARSFLRLNPFQLPGAPEDWPRVLPDWHLWLRTLGVTPAGLGREAYRHSLAAVTLTAWAAAERGLLFDPPGLRQALDAPEFLGSLEHAGSESLFSEAEWGWWQSEGRIVPNFDVHLRLGHLRDRLGKLLDLPEYSVLWREPYLDLGQALQDRTALFWRLPDQDGRRHAYIVSLFAALAASLRVWPEETPVLLFFYNLDPGPWAERLGAIPSARLFLAADTPAGLPDRPRPQTLIVSRLGKAGADQLYPHLPGMRAADLRRLPEDRLVIRRGNVLGTIAPIGR